MFSLYLDRVEVLLESFEGKVVVEPEQRGEVDALLEKVFVLGLVDQVHQKQVRLVVVRRQNKQRVLVDVLEDFLSVEVVARVRLVLGLPGQPHRVALLDFVLLGQVGPADDFNGQRVLVLEEKGLVDFVLDLVHAPDQVVLRLELPAPC